MRVLLPLSKHSNKANFDCGECNSVNYLDSTESGILISEDEAIDFEEIKKYAATTRPTSPLIQNQEVPQHQNLEFEVAGCDDNNTAHHGEEEESSIPDQQPLSENHLDLNLHDSVAANCTDKEGELESVRPSSPAEVVSTASSIQRERRPRKRAPSVPSISCSPADPSSTCESVSSKAVTQCNIVAQAQTKRPRPDSKPAAKIVPKSLNQTSVPSTQSDCGAMAIGNRQRYDSDDENTDVSHDLIYNNNRPGRYNHNHSVHVQFLLTPAENEPTSFSNRPIVPPNHASTGSRTGRKQQPDRDNSAGPLETDCLEGKFGAALKKKGFEMVEQEGDGNCLFRAVSLQVYGHADHHTEVRERCMDFMESNEEHYSNFVAADIDEQNIGETFAEYVARKRKHGVHGNHAEIQAISELFNRPVEVYTPNSLELNGNNTEDFKLKPINIFHTEYKSSEYPIRLSYHDGNHYNAIIDPLVPTAGLGLGLPGLQPGLADKMQVAAAVTESDELADQMELERILKESAFEHQKKSTDNENDDLQRALKESAYSMNLVYEKKAIVLSDVDATNFELEQEALAKSWDSYSGQEHGRKQRASPLTNSNRRSNRMSPGPATVSSPQLPLFMESSSSVAAIPTSAYASASSATAAAASASVDPPESGNQSYGELSATEYPQSVQELVVNGFDLKRVVRAYELVGDNFDDMLSFLISTSSST